MYLFANEKFSRDEIGSNIERYLKDEGPFDETQKAVMRTGIEAIKTKMGAWQGRHAEVGYYTDHAGQHSLCVAAICQRLLSFFNTSEYYSAIVRDSHQLFVFYIAALLHDAKMLSEKREQHWKWSSDVDIPELSVLYGIDDRYLAEAAPIVALHSSREHRVLIDLPKGPLRLMGLVLRMSDALDCTSARVINNTGKEAVKECQRKEDYWQSAVQTVALYPTGEHGIGIRLDVSRTIGRTIKQDSRFDVISAAKKNLQKDIIDLKGIVLEFGKTISADIPTECYDKENPAEQNLLAIYYKQQAERAARAFLAGLLGMDLSTELEVIERDECTKCLFTKKEIHSLLRETRAPSRESDWESRHREYIEYINPFEEYDLRMLNRFIQTLLGEKDGCDNHNKYQKRIWKHGKGRSRNMLHFLSSAAFYSRAVYLGRNIGNDAFVDFSENCVAFSNLAYELLSSLGKKGNEPPPRLGSLKFPLRCLGCDDWPVNCLSVCRTYLVPESLQTAKRRIKVWGARAGYSADDTGIIRQFVEPFRFTDGLMLENGRFIEKCSYNVATNCRIARRFNGVHPDVDARIINLAEFRILTSAARPSDDRKWKLDPSVWIAGEPEAEFRLRVWSQPRDMNNAKYWCTEHGVANPRLLIVSLFVDSVTGKIKESIEEPNHRTVARVLVVVRIGDKLAER